MEGAAILLGVCNMPPMIQQMRHPDKGPEPGRMVAPIRNQEAGRQVCPARSRCLLPISHPAVTLLFVRRLTDAGLASSLVLIPGVS
jgi:hypothetical protein